MTPPSANRHLGFYFTESMNVARNVPIHTSWVLFSDRAALWSPGWPWTCNPLVYLPSTGMCATCLAIYVFLWGHTFSFLFVMLLSVQLLGFMITIYHFEGLPFSPPAVGKEPHNHTQSSMYIPVIWSLWSATSLWFWFVLQWLMMLSLFSHVLGHLYEFSREMYDWIICVFLNCLICLLHNEGFIFDTRPLSIICRYCLQFYD